MDHIAGDSGAIDCAVGSADPLNITYEIHLFKQNRYHVMVMQSVMVRRQKRRYWQTLVDAERFSVLKILGKVAYL